MTVTKRSSREKAQRTIDDLQVGDMVFNYVSRMKGAVMEVSNGLVLVDYLDGSRDELPPAAFRRCRAGGADFDHRRRP